MRFARLLLLLALLPIGTAAAHGDHDDAIRIRILLGEMYFQVDGQAKGEPLRLQAGQDYELVFENVGAMQHEVLFGRELVKKDGRPVGYRTNLLEDVEVEIAAVQTVDGKPRQLLVEANGFEELYLDPGASVTLGFELPAAAKGRWELGCFIAGHYEGGMKLDLVVE